MEEELKIANEMNLDSQWNLVQAIRETFGIAGKGSVNPTYKQAIKMAMTIAPSLLDENSEIYESSLSKTALKYKQKADAINSQNDKKTTAIKLIEKEAVDLQNIISNSPFNIQIDQLRKEYNDLRLAQQELSSVPYTENEIIFQDYECERNLPISGSGRSYKEFALPNDRVLRIRVLHPNKAEAITGTDVIYENYYLEKHLVRIAAIQYKVWKEKVLYSDSRIDSQLSKMKSTFCKNDLCNEDSLNNGKYRFPYCSAFLRPTDKLQSPTSKKISSGYHIPLCVVERKWSSTYGGEKKLVSSAIRDECVTQKNFEELFNSNMLGSRWLDISWLEQFYKDNNVLNTQERIVIHAQEF